MISEFRDAKSYSDALDASRKRLEKCGMFDLKGCDNTLGLQERICNKWSPCPGKVLLYAKMGLHRYNLLQGTKFQLIRVKKYILSIGSPVGSYYITLYAIAAGSSLQTFQTRVSEEEGGKFILTCKIARIQGETSHSKRVMYMGTSLPEWPPENPFEKCYLVKESELQDNDWIRLYLELAVATTTGRDCGLSNKLEIVKVAIDDALNAKNAIIYIRYNDLYKAELGKDSDRIAIVRRSFDEDTGCFMLVGQTQSSEIIPKNPSLVVANEDTGCLSLKGQNQFIKGFAENKRIKLNPTGLANQISSSLATCEDHQVANQHSSDVETARESMK
ncbi:hypothetical protein EUTSA_v10004573mg [Eutrema salsugineum]|uniref:Uncharacterized protein n=2 Tax=Eutrema salsugineum TaxID=72664 RepID=V4KNF1_EUTSA|nr:hypothetical protein EUTSA_v10004573mg [Eutrema salsugineum]